jgi:multidrug efflux pump subunit AcrA (membrane-fusion protein)
MTAYVRIENIPQRRFKGTVRRVAPVPDAQMSWLNPDSKVHATDILIEEELPELKPAVSARAEVVITNLSNVLSVPIHTVVRLMGDNVCYVKRGPTVKPVTVATGWFNDQFIEITSGLKEGDQVLLAPMSDEPEESVSAETNSVSAPAAPAAPPRPEEQVQRPGSESPEAEVGSERRRARQGGGGRRSPRAEEPPE